MASNLARDGHRPSLIHWAPPATRFDVEDLNHLPALLSTQSGHAARAHKSGYGDGIRPPPGLPPPRAPMPRWHGKSVFQGVAGQVRRCRHVRRRSRRSGGMLWSMV